MSKYAKLTGVMERPDDISALSQEHVDASVRSVANNLAKGRGKDVGRGGLTIYDKGRAVHYCLDLIEQECRVSKRQAEDARFAIGVSKETWVEIASGELAPMDAFLQGRMAVSGDVEFGIRLYAKVAAKRGRADYRLA